MLTKQKAYQFEEIINYIKDLYINRGEKALYSDNDWCVYAQNLNIKLDSVCYIDDYPDIDDNDEEIYSDFVRENNLEFVYNAELLHDVMMNALWHDQNISNQNILEAIEYYEENDDFLF